MFNTNTPENAYWFYSDDLQGFRVEASAEIKEGEEVYDWYGYKCNSDFLKNYGFINLDKNGENRDNQFPLIAKLDENDENYNVKWDVFMLGSDKFQTYEYYIYGHMDDRQVWDNFLAWMRFVVFDGDLSELYEHVKENQAENVKRA